MSNSKRRIYDCVLYNGEKDVLEIRLQEIGDAVDHVVVVESDCSFSGMPREIKWNPNDPRFTDFVDRIRHVVVRDMPNTTNPWDREEWQRNAVLRGIPDAEPDDIVVVSDVDEIPRASVLHEISTNSACRVFGLRMAFFYFFVNYRNVEGPEKSITWSVAACRSELDRVSPNDLRYRVRDGTEPACIYDDGGWHFSYLSDKDGIKDKIAAFSHQELNDPEFLKRLDIAAIIKRGGDLFDRPGFVWRVVDFGELPDWLVRNRWRLAHLFYPRNKPEAALSRTMAFLPFRRVRRRKPPVIICPYTQAKEREEIHDKFDLDGPAGRRLPFFSWHDTKMLGPERAFEHCWTQFPDRDIVILHSDMAPMPDDRKNEWYEKLISYRDSLPKAAMVACNLFYPSPEGKPSRVQCAGGTYIDCRIDYLRGEIGEKGISLDLLEQVREVDWVTFGGVLIRREAIQACGAFAGRYRWAYVMDVDYSFEARLRGFRLYQVPVSLIHEASRTTVQLMDADPSLRRAISENFVVFEDKWKPYAPLFMPPSQAK